MGIKNNKRKALAEYQKTEWIDNQTVIDAAKLNKIENALSLLTTAANEIDSGITTKVEEAVSNIEIPQGSKGDKGDPGIQGPAGPQGERGPQGLTGATGPAGPQGARGAQGPAGATGPKGDKGDPGAQGPQGLTGPTGTFDPNVTFTELNTTNKTIPGAINEVLQNVSNGKSSIAQAITSKGVSASENDSFETLSNKVKKIKIKKYDKDETLTEGSNFNFLEAFLEDNLIKRYSLRGNFISNANDGHLFITEQQSFGTMCLMYKYNPDTDSFTELGDSLDMNPSFIVGPYIVKNTDGRNQLFNIENTEIALPQINASPESYNYFAEADGEVFLATLYEVSGGEIGGIPTPPGVKVNFYKHNGSSFEVLRENIDLRTFSIESPEEISFAASNKYFAITLKSRGSIYNKIFLRTNYSLTEYKYTSQYLFTNKPFCICNDYLIYTRSTSPNESYITIQNITKANNKTEFKVELTEYMNYMFASNRKVAFDEDKKILYIPITSPQDDSVIDTVYKINISTDMPSITSENIYNLKTPHRRGDVFNKKRFVYSELKKNTSKIILL